MVTAGFAKDRGEVKEALWHLLAGFQFTVLTALFRHCKNNKVCEGYR